MNPCDRGTDIAVPWVPLVEYLIRRGYYEAAQHVVQRVIARHFYGS
jgi:hypothetical protein